MTGQEPWEYRVSQGGLMRCCLESLDRQLAERLARGEPAPPEGHKVRCEYCLTPMVQRSGTFEWDQEDDS